MNKKGITLIEVIAVIALIALIAGLIFPNANRIINRTNKDTNEIQDKAIVEAAKLYLTDHIGEDIDFDEQPSVNISLKQLVDEGYINNNPKQPDTNKSYNLNTSYVTITKNNNSYKYALTLNT